MRPRKIEIGGGSTAQEQLGASAEKVRKRRDGTNVRSLHRGAFGHPAFRFAG
jgi:hypothetical protein